METAYEPQPRGATYELRVAEQLDVHWEAWFDSCVLRRDTDGSTLLQRFCEDQAALYGLISQLRDLGLTLIAVRRSPGPG